MCAIEPVYVFLKGFREDRDHHDKLVIAIVREILLLCIRPNYPNFCGIVRTGKQCTKDIPVHPFGWSFMLLGIFRTKRVD